MKLPVLTAESGFSLAADPAAGEDAAGSLDCVVVGFNDMNFHERAMRAQETERASAYYADVKLNSVRLDGRRLNYLDLLNRAVFEATGRDPDLNTFHQPNLAVCYLTSFLRKRGLATEFVNLVSHEKERFRELLSRAPRAVAITTTFYVESEPIVDLIRVIREHAPDTKIVVGGPYISRICAFFDVMTQDYLLALLGADIYVADSQGESSLAALLHALRRDARADLSAVPNLIWTSGEGTLRRSPRVMEKNDLDANSIDWSLFDPGYLAPTVYMRTARSCAFTCSFCSYPAVGGEHVASDVEGIVDQLRRLRDMGVKQVVFTDDTFNVPLPRFKKLMRRMIEERIGMRWASFFRCSNADDEAFELMEKAGCLGVFLGIESGDQGVLENMDKHAKVDRYKWGIKRLADHGIVTYASLIVGFPGESRRSVENTIEFIETARPTLYFPNIYYHDVRSPIQEQAAQFGIRGTGYSWSHATMDWREAVESTRTMYQKIESSTLCAGYSLSFWGVFYLLGQGFTMDQIVSFMRIARPMVLESYDDRDATGFDKLVSLFRA